MKPSNEERITIWKFAYARNCLLKCRCFLDQLESQNKYPSGVISALTDAALISYGNPFTNWNILPQIPGGQKKIADKPLAQINPPTNLKNAHDQLIYLRDKVVAHTDGVVGQFGKTNVVHILRDAEGFDVPTIQLATLHPSLVVNAKQLCAFYIAHCEHELNIIIGKYKDSIFALDVGTYELILDPSDDWLKLL